MAASLALAALAALLAFIASRYGGSVYHGVMAFDSPPQLRTIDPADLDRRSIYGLLNSIVVPRPIAWVSTISSAGVANLAPHSYATIASVMPPTVLFVSIGEKDTVRNARDTGSFVYHVSNEALAEQMNASSASAPAEVSEFDLTGLTRVPSVRVAPPRLAESPVALECEVERIIEVGDEPSFAVLGRVVLIHAHEDVVDDRGYMDPTRLGAVARMGGSLYSTTRDTFAMERPIYTPS